MSVQSYGAVWLTKSTIRTSLDAWKNRFPISEAKTRLSELIRRVEGGDEIVIRRGPTPVARLIREPSGRVLPPGSVAGISGRLAADFDHPLEDFAEYLEDAG